MAGVSTPCGITAVFSSHQTKKPSVCRGIEGGLTYLSFFLSHSLSGGFAFPASNQNRPTIHQIWWIQNQQTKTPDCSRTIRGYKIAGHTRDFNPHPLSLAGPQLRRAAIGPRFQYITFREQYQAKTLAKKKPSTPGDRGQCIPAKNRPDKRGSFGLAYISR